MGMMGRMGLSARLGVFSFAMAVVPILAMSAVSAFIMYKFYKSSVDDSEAALSKQAQEEMTQSVRKEATILSEFISSTSVNVRNLAKSKNVASYLDALDADDAETRKDVLAEAKRVLESSLQICASQQSALEAAIVSHLAVAYKLLESEGGVKSLGGKSSWKAVNQLDGKTQALELPTLSVGGRTLEAYAGFDKESPVVDKLGSLVGQGTTCTIFQRMNEDGDMLRVATSVRKLDGKRAIGTYIPAKNPDGKPNPVLSAVLDGETYIGRALVVDSWCITAYKPLRDASGKISGMLYVGVKEQSDARLVKSIASYSNSEMKLFVIDDGGNMVFGGPAGSDGKQAAAAMGLNVLSQVPDKAKPGAVGSLSYETNGRTRLLTWIPFPGWRWIICADIDMTRWRETNIAERLEVMKSEINAVHGASFVTRKDGAILDYLTQIRVFDAKGSELLVMKTGNFEKKLGNRAGTEWYEAALKLKKEQVSFSRLELSLNTKLPELRISSPIYEKNALRGLVVFNLDWEAVGELLARDKPAGGGYFFVVDPDGVLVSHPKHSLKNVFSLTDEKNNEVGDQLRKIAREEMTKGKAGFARYAFDGVEKFVAYEPLKIGDYSYSVCAGVSVKDSLKLVEDLKKGAADNSKAALLWVVVAFLALAALGLLAGLALGAALAGPLRRISASMKDESANVQAASLQISSASAALAEGASRQAAGIEEISASIAQIGAMLKRSADNARGADALSKEADQAAEGGLEAMRLMGGAMARINESAVETSKIAKTIEEIAFQTNLLALNAAVEAARAGDAGRGFAVVAEEVRSLAQRSAQAARETARLIDESKASAKEGVVANEKAHERIASIKESFEKVRALVEDIANGVKEQSAGVDQISKSVVELEGVTQSNAASAEETAASANQLAGNAERLDGVVGSLTELVEGEKTAEGAARRALASTPECKNAALEDNASRKRLK